MMKLLSRLLKFFITILLFIYLYNIFWLFNGIKIVKLEKVCREYISPNDNKTLIVTYSFVVYGYHHSKTNEKKLDSFACSQANSLLNKYKTVLINFYKFSLVTNNTYYKENYYDAQSYSDSHDYLWHYGFDRDDKSVYKYKVKNKENLKFYYPNPKCWKGELSN